MKKIALFILILPSFLFAQKPHAGYPIKEADSTGITWQIVGTESDTSSWKMSYDVMTIYFFSRDTTTGAGGDSVNARLYFQTSSSSKNFPVTDRYIDVADDSVYSHWKLTQVAIGSGMYWRLIITGLTGNDQDAGSLFDLEFDGSEK